MSLLAQSLAEARQDLFDSYRDAFRAGSELRELWSAEAEESRDGDVSDADTDATVPTHSASQPASDPLPFPTERFDCRNLDVEPHGWSIAFTPTFRKSVAAVDKNLQGRVLAALSVLVDAPDKVHGDTMKPLIGEFKGLWRYRVGDYRLVYQPRQDRHTVVLIDFGPRGGVYES